MRGITAGNEHGAASCAGSSIARGQQQAASCTAGTGGWCRAHIDGARRAAKRSIVAALNGNATAGGGGIRSSAG